MTWGHSGRSLSGLWLPSTGLSQLAPSLFPLQPGKVFNLPTDPRLVLGGGERKRSKYGRDTNRSITSTRISGVLLRPKRCSRPEAAATSRQTQPLVSLKGSWRWQLGMAVMATIYGALLCAGCCVISFPSCNHIMTCRYYPHFIGGEIEA